MQFAVLSDFSNYSLHNVRLIHQLVNDLVL